MFEWLPEPMLRRKDYLRYTVKRESLIRRLSDTRRRRFREYRKSGYQRQAAYYAALNGICSDGYIPENVYFGIIEPRLNRLYYATLFREKNVFDQMFPDITPRTIARVVNARVVDRDFRPLEAGHFASFASPEIVVKPSKDSGGGQGLHFVPLAEIESFLDQHVKRFPNADLVLQEPIRQNARYAKFHPSSINTLRIMTLRIEGEIRVLSTLYRVGRSGGRIDNQSAGGLACGVEQGVLKQTAFDVLDNAYEEHPDSGMRFGGYELPHARDAESLVVDIHDRIPFLDIISWDVAIAEDDEPIVIEMNAKYQGINVQQTCNGPVFADVKEHLLSDSRSSK